MTSIHADRLARPVDPDRDHILGSPLADITLVEYGSYACGFCHTAHEVVAGLRDRFGDRMRYVFRHLPIKGSEDAVPAAEVAEYASETKGKFWEMHDALMKRGPTFAPNELDEIAAEWGLPQRQEWTADAAANAAARVKEDARGALRSGAHVTPTFFINGRRYEGAWDEGALAEAMLGSLGHRVQAAA
ncbi:MAG TPA: thioredoxin domain-containing protein, partial [Thermoanaerobaculia bacterium]|nr:thioredoxin domain-containing protein [Thermoanaerobaculia bacterium]